MVMMGGQWRDPVERYNAAVAAAHAWQDEERRAAFDRIKGLAELWPDWKPGQEGAVAQ
jgi:hypothetical protein